MPHDPRPAALCAAPAGAEGAAGAVTVDGAGGVVAGAGSAFFPKMLTYPS